MVRRLPVIQPEEEDPPRPPWRWVLLGGGLSLCLWGVLASLLLPLSARVGATDAGRGLGAVAALSSFGLAVAAGAYLVGRHGPGDQPRLGAAVGAVAAALAWTLALSLGAPIAAAAAVLSLLALAVVGVGAGWVAGFLGHRRRRSVASGASRR